MVRLLLAALIATAPVRLDGVEKAAALARGHAAARAHKDLDNAGRRARVRQDVGRAVADLVGAPNPDELAFVDWAVEKAAQPFDRDPPPAPVRTKSSYYVLIRGYVFVVLGYVEGGNLVWELGDQPEDLQRFYRGY